ncbi:MAG: hypothetical protein ACI92I_000262 [Acidimicrobiales bacterium]|jgi:hypothetical protein
MQKAGDHSISRIRTFDDDVARARGTKTTSTPKLKKEPASVQQVTDSLLGTSTKIPSLKKEKLGEVPQIKSTKNLKPIPKKEIPPPPKIVSIPKKDDAKKTHTKNFPVEGKSSDDFLTQSAKPSVTPIPEKELGGSKSPVTKIPPPPQLSVVPKKERGADHVRTKDKRVTASEKGSIVTVHNTDPDANEGVVKKNTHSAEVDKFKEHSKVMQQTADDFLKNKSKNVIPAPPTQKKIPRGIEEHIESAKLVASKKSHLTDSDTVHEVTSSDFGDATIISDRIERHKLFPDLVAATHSWLEGGHTNALDKYETSQTAAQSQVLQVVKNAQKQNTSSKEVVAVEMKKELPPIPVPKKEIPPPPKIVSIPKKDDAKKTHTKNFPVEGKSSDDFLTQSAKPSVTPIPEKELGGSKSPVTKIPPPPQLSVVPKKQVAKTDITQVPPQVETSRESTKADIQITESDTSADTVVTTTNNQVSEISAPSFIASDEINLPQTQQQLPAEKVVIEVPQVVEMKIPPVPEVHWEPEPIAPLEVIEHLVPTPQEVDYGPEVPQPMVEALQDTSTIPHEVETVRTQTIPGVEILAQDLVSATQPTEVPEEQWESTEETSVEVVEQLVPHNVVVTRKQTISDKSKWPSVTADELEESYATLKTVNEDVYPEEREIAENADIFIPLIQQASRPTSDTQATDSFVPNYTAEIPPTVPHQEEPQVNELLQTDQVVLPTEVIEQIPAYETPQFVPITLPDTQPIQTQTAEEMPVYTEEVVTSLTPDEPSTSLERMLPVTDLDSFIPRMAAVSESVPQEKRTFKPAVTSVSRVPIYVYLLVIIGASLLGIGTSVYWFTSSTATEEAVVIRIPSLFAVNIQIPIPLEETKVGTLTTILNESLAANETIQIYPTVTDETGQSHPTDVQELLFALQLRAPGSFTRSINDIAFGSYNGAKPFVLMSVTSFDTAFAGMLAWEPVLSEDLSPLFGDPVTESYDPYARTETQIRPAFFRDTVIANKSARVLVDTANIERILYSFVQPNLILITSDSDTLNAIIPLIK